MTPLIWFLVGASFLLALYAMGARRVNGRIVLLRWRDLSPVGQVTWGAIIAWFVYSFVLVLGGCSGEDPDPDPTAYTAPGGHAGASGASAGQAGASGSSAGHAGASGSSAGHAGAAGLSASGGSGGSTASLPPGCAAVPGDSPECSADKKKWFVECAAAPTGCTKHSFLTDVYCCQVIP